MEIERKSVGWLAAVLMAGSLLLPLASAAHASAAAQGRATLTFAQPLTPRAVEEIQNRLRHLGFFAGASDGVWGGDSAAALERFEQSRGLPVAGQLDQATAATLGLSPADLLAPGQPGGAASSMPAPQRTAAGGQLRPDAVRTIQQQLKELGFYSGPLDGAWGPSIEDSIRNFQQTRGMDATGQLNPSTIIAMGLTPKDLAPPTLAAHSSASASTPE